GEDEAGAEDRPRLEPRRRPDLVHAAGHVPEGDGGPRHQAADEAAAGLVVAGEEQPEGAHLQGVEHHPHRAVEQDEPVQASASCFSMWWGRRLARASATAPMAAAASTVISPMVSRPRKSTRITFTTLPAWPPGRPRSATAPATGPAARPV